MTIKLGSTLLVCLGLTACSINTTQPETWQNFSEQKVSAANLNKGESLVVFYREPNTQGEAIDIFVNHDYQTSLLESGYSAIKLCANQNFISTSYISNQHFGNRTSGVYFYSPSQQITYVKVTADQLSGEPVFRFVDNKTGEKDIKQLQYQHNVLSRVIAKDCGHHDYVIATYQVPFGFDQAELKASTQAKQDLNTFAQRLEGNISKVQIEGYADPVGSESYNQKLSLKRANTVAKIIQQNHPALELTSNGNGENNLVIEHCEQQFKGNKELINQCNAENRRVEIIVFGQN